MQRIETETDSGSKSKSESESESKNEIELVSPSKTKDKYIYFLNQKLGSGGYGQVFRGIRTKDSAEITVKVVKFDPAIQEHKLLFINEVVVLKKIYSDGQCSMHNVLCILDGFISLPQNSGYIITQYIANAIDLFTYIPQFKHHSVETNLDICRQLFIALKYIHGLGLVHMDIKPENILVVPLTGANSKIKITLIDFGYSCESHKCTAKGTIDYLAPEVGNDIKLTNKVDIFSLGATLFRCFHPEHLLPYNGRKLHKWYRYKNMYQSIDIPSRPIPKNNFIPLIDENYPFIRNMISTDSELRPSATDLLLFLDSTQ